MEDTLEVFHVPQQSRRIKLRITPPDQQHYDDNNNIYPPVLLNTRFDPHHHHHHYPHIPTATAVPSSASPSPSPSPSQFPPHPRFNPFTSSLAMNNNAEIIGPDQMIPTSSNSSGSKRFHADRVRDSGVEVLGNNPSDTAMVSGGGLNLSLATHARGQMSAGGRCSRSAAAIAMAAAPAGPFTGYASILSRSRFLKPAEELLDGFCGGFRRENQRNVLDDSIGDVEEDWTARVNVTDRCGGSSNLISLLHEVYKRYRIYCQQMHSAVKSFESVAGLGNAAPFISFAIKAVSKHFHCLKNAILDHINFTNNGLSSGSEEYGKRAGSNNTMSAFGEQKQLRKPSINHQHHHPVWRSQRGFPDKAVAVLKAWLFENFLHPYPTDSDKEMLARRTGLSRSQVSNWFTNARVRLWKPMVEEIHSLEKQSGFSAESQHRKFTNTLTTNHYSLMSPQTQPSDRHIQDSGIQRVGFSLQAGVQDRDEPPPQTQQQQNQALFPCNILSINGQLVASASGNAGGEIGNRRVTNSSSNVYSSGGGDSSATGMPWSTTTYGQSVPFWLSK